LKEQILYLFQQYPQWAVAISLLASIIVAVLGLVPSVFITAANILFFGFWKGTLLSFLGETIGAAVAFFLYRSGFKQISRNGLKKFPKAERLLHAKGREAFFLILSLRLIPFVPSGLVTFAAAIGHVPALLFITASSLGKIPALLLEAGSVYGFVHVGWPVRILMAALALVLLFVVVKRQNKP
jgi:uncharacterized membrane protein YdjX (TVP38/TMEM64 family)